MTEAFRAVLLTALRVEYNAVRKLLANERKVTAADGTMYRVGSLALKPGIDTVIDWEIAIHRSQAGQAQAALETEKIIQAHKPDVVIFVGVAGGRPGKVELGDLVIPSEIGYFESGKVTSAGFIDRQRKYYPSRSLFQAAQVESDDTDWLRWLKSAAPNQPPTVHMEPIVTGEKVITHTGSDLWKFIEAEFDQAVAIEMEGHGFMLAAHANSAESLVVRGISDLVDDKNSPVVRDGERQEIASDRAAAFVAQLLHNLSPASLKKKKITSGSAFGAS